MLPRRNALGQFSRTGRHISVGGHLRRLPTAPRAAPLSAEARVRALDAFDFMQQGLSLNRAAQEAHTTPSTVLRVGHKEHALRKEDGQWTLRSTPGATFHRQYLGEDGEWHRVSVFGTRNADLLRDYVKAIRTRDRDRGAAVAKFRGKTFTDSQGREHTLVTDRKRLADLDRAGRLEPPPGRRYQR